MWGKVAGGPAVKLITEQQLQQGVGLLIGSHPSEKTTSWLMASFDTHKRKQLDQTEFSNLTDYLLDWRDCFTSCGVGDEGVDELSQAEVFLATQNFGYEVDEKTFAVIFETYDTDDSGSLGFLEFIQLFSELNLYTQLFNQKCNKGKTAVMSWDAFCSAIYTIPRPGSKA
eukprot:Filipodium_phascolosomae@DN7126_c0_g1_i1.p1